MIPGLKLSSETEGLNFGHCSDNWIEGIENEKVYNFIFTELRKKG